MDMTTTRAAILALILVGLGTPARAQSAAGDPVLTGYRLLFGGDKLAAIRYFESQLRQRPADLALRFGSLFARDSRLALDSNDRGPFERDIEAFIDVASKRYGRSRQDAEALFYLAQAHMLRATYRFEYDRGLWGAARDAVKAKGYSDTYLKQHAEHGDAYLTLGLYNYYVDIAPAFVRVLRLILFLPSGNRAEGLKQLERAASQGSLFAPQAGLVLIEVYSTFEGRIADAQAVGERLKRAYPANDQVDFEIAQLYAPRSKTTGAPPSPTRPLSIAEGTTRP